MILFTKSSLRKAIYTAFFLWFSSTWVSHASINDCSSLHIVFGGSHYTDFVGTDEYFYFLNPRELQGQKENGVSNAIQTEISDLDNVQWQKMIRVEAENYYLLRSSKGSACAVKVNTAGEILDAHDCSIPINSFSPEKGCH